MSMYNEVHIRPTEITFFLSADSVCSPEEVLILSKNQKTLKYKILCTARSRYSLSKCKGSLKPGESIRISIQLLIPTCEKSRRDFFKIQFFDYLDDSLQGERLISSTVHVDSSRISVRASDSGSCSSWRSQPIDSSTAPGSRTLSLTRNVYSLPSDQFAANSASNSNLAAIDWKPQTKKLKAISTHCNAIDKAQTVTSSGLKSSCHTVHTFQRCSSCLHTFVYWVAFFLCLFGVCLPMITDDLASLLRHLLPHDFTPFAPTSAVSSDTCAAPIDVTSSSYFSQRSFAHHRPLSPDEFTRHSKLAILSFKAAFWNIVGALGSLDAIHLISNFSWFGLGLLVMYSLRRD